MHSITLWLHEPEVAETFLVEALGFTGARAFKGLQEERQRLVADAGARPATIDLLRTDQACYASRGAGQVHHAALTAPEPTVRSAQAFAARHGLDCTTVEREGDRVSTYVTLGSGVMFELIHGTYSDGADGGLL
jgi:hypothetical protein